MLSKDQFLKFYANQPNQFWKDIQSLGFVRDKKSTEGTASIDEEKDFDDDDFDIDDFLESDEFKKRSEIEKIEDNTFRRNSEFIKDYQQFGHGDSKQIERLNTIFVINQRLVNKIALRYKQMIQGTCLDYDDLISFGNAGLFKAIDRFVPDMGYQFSTYATWWIRQSITRGIADESRLIRLPVHLHEKIMKVKNVEMRYENEHGGIDVEDLCKSLDMSQTDYWKLKRITYQFDHMPRLETLVGSDGETELQDLLPINLTLGSQITPPEFMLTPDEQFEKKELHHEIEKLMDCLKPREIDVIKLRFGIDHPEMMTLEEIGKMFHLTRERIRQIEAKALGKLRYKMRKNNLKEFIKG
ncbi:sigma-70 family RNA polymerase sigma factor [Sporolactobacillus pectinivorans]|uniref:sigma-70 family RNA polymerase sigma factor n=1 Tax=Sporolactobacillus pectinivorans TaxID=1591408 RepID=UPI001EFE66A5|nr:sigma-70 family RNA polymerase sigma factor [Sporolactobacillus pectinivorans]